MFDFKLDLLKNFGWTKIGMEVDDGYFKINGFYIPPFDSTIPLKLSSDGLQFETQIHTLTKNKQLGNYKCDVYEVNATGHVITENEIISIYTTYENGARANSKYHDWFWLHNSLEESLPELDMMLYIGADDKYWFHFAGSTWAEKSLKIWEDYTCKNRHELKNILDYGCGVARVSRHYPKLCDAKITGLDIDDKSINWCKVNLPEHEWLCVDSDSTLPIKNNTMDLIIGHSVFTHFEEEVQLEKLNELSRIIKQDGLVMLTILGEYAHFLEPISIEEEKVLYEYGIISPKTLKALSYKHPLIKAKYPDYHKGVFNTHKYIKEKWTINFDIIGIIEGFADHQALVLLKKK